MEFIFSKRGKIFDPSLRFDWMQAYSQVPTVLVLKDRLRIYFTCRSEPDVDSSYVSYISFIEVDKYNPENIIYVHPKPVLNLGGLGTFDQFGTMPGSILEIEGNLALFYTGWVREKATPYFTSIGLAISYDKGLMFDNGNNGPLISRNFNDPYLVNGPWVLKVGKLYHMWYSSGSGWTENENGHDPIYLIKHAVSEDATCWITTKGFIVETKLADEAQNRPCVFYHNGLYHMLFSYRGSVNFREPNKGYKMGYASSEDLVKWVRDDSRVKLESSGESEWDSEMIAYPSICKVGNLLFLFYNGNHFGKFGFGYARMDI